MELNERIADALTEAKSVSNEGIIPSDKLKPKVRVILVNSGFLKQIVRGWYMLVSAVSAGSSTPWFSMFWPFLRQYLTDRFGEDGYCLSPQSSLDIYTGETTIPTQLIILTGKSSNSKVDLPYNLSLLLYQDEKSLPDNFDKRNGVNIMPLPYSIVKAPPSYFNSKPHNIEIALSMVESVPDISRVLMKIKAVASAERIAGAYEQTGNEVAAKIIINDMKLEGYTIKPVKPFTNFIPSIGMKVFRSPYAARIISMWHSFRNDIIQMFPAPEISVSSDRIDIIIKEIEKKSQEDAYHSLSIEGYKVTDELISKIRSGDWNPDNNAIDNNLDATLAAKGYSLAHIEVVNSIITAFKSGKPATIFRNSLADWYRQLFFPMIQTGILKPADLTGYRRNPVYIRNAMHIPPPYDAVVDSMDTLFQLLEDEENGAVRSVLGHYFFVFIHPYMDGNGRLARFLMNMMLVTSGYPWTIIKVSERTEYMKALDLVAADKDIKPFTNLIIKEMISQ